MDCKSVIEEQILEKYIADTLDKKDRKACDEHLHGCESCKGELEFQMLLLAGINDSAKDAMKNEIRQQVSTRKTHQGRFIYYSENIYLNLKNHSSLTIICLTKTLISLISLLRSPSILY